MTKLRLAGLVLSLLQIFFAAVSLFFVAKIVGLGGHRYEWEYIIPAILMLAGIVSFGTWTYWISRSRNDKRRAA